MCELGRRARSKSAAASRVGTPGSTCQRAIFLGRQLARSNCISSTLGAVSERSSWSLQNVSNDKSPSKTLVHPAASGISHVDVVGGSFQDLGTAR
eukprot:4012987-Pyramimonas_sp.AAC.1